MKASLPRTTLSLTIIALGLSLLGGAAFAAEPTAFELVKEGNRHVGQEAQDRVVQIRSEKSIGTLTPNIWYVVYYDPDATAKATEVKFAAGKKVSVKRPARILEPITGAHKELDRTKLKIDSDKALDIARNEPLLKNLTLKASQFWLERQGPDHQPAWKIRLWAAKLNNPNSSANIGDLWVSAQNGKVLENDLHIDRVD